MGKWNFSEWDKKVKPSATHVAEAADGGFKPPRLVDAGARVRSAPSGGSPDRLHPLSPCSSPSRGLFLLSGQDILIRRVSR